MERQLWQISAGNFVVKEAMELLSAKASTGGTRPRPNSASMKRKSYGTMTFLCRSSLARKFNVVAAVAGVHDKQSVASARQDRAKRSNFHTTCFNSRHSWSNQGSDGRHRIVTVVAGIRHSSMSVVTD